MTIWQPDISNFQGPRYQAIVAALDQAVRDGILLPGSKLPTVRDLAYRIGVTVGTVSRAYQLAEERGLVSGEVGRGTFVQTLPASQLDAATVALLEDKDSDLISMARNIPVSGPAAAALGASLRRITTRVEASPAFALSLVDYNFLEAEHEQRYRAAGAQWLARTGVQAKPEQIIVTVGSQNALALIAGTLVKPGEKIFTETLTYIGVGNAADLYGIELMPIPRDAEGMLPDALEAAARNGQARLVFLVPTHSNPIGSTMSLTRRKAIVEVAQRHNLYIIEDDVYGFLPPDRPAPIQTLAPERTLYLTSASKCIMPGMRVAWLAAPTELIEPLLERQQAMMITPSSLPLEVITGWIEDGTANRLVESQRIEIEARRSIAAEILQGFNVNLPPYSLHGFWQLPEPWSAEDFAAHAYRRGVEVTPAHAFSVAQTSAPQGVRLALGEPASRGRLKQGLTILAEVAREIPNLRRSAIL